MNRLMAAIERILALAFIVAVCLNFANVVGRYGFGTSIAGGDEVQVYIMVWMAFLGAVLVSWRGEHLRMDVLAKRFPQTGRKGLEWVELVLVIALAAFALWQSWNYTEQMMAIGRRSDHAGIPMWIPHSAVGLGFALVLLVALLQFFKKSR
jgi:TRAP-type C4-dicarboxylate transport system permease small subunit